MSDIRLYVDEDAEQKALVEGLQSRGIDVLSALVAQMIGRPDREQLEFAIARQRAVYTLNVGDFANLHREYMEAGKDHFGIVVIPKQRYAVGEKIRRLTELVQSKSAEELRNRIEFL
jgi:hypothetical protein